MLNALKVVGALNMPLVPLKLGERKMQYKKDKSTIDIFTGAAPVGRPRLHQSNAVKQRLYRQRKKGKTSCN